MLEVLAAVCREAPLREKIVVVPSLAIGHQIGDALARSGTAWVNLRFETTRTIADALAGFELAREGWTVLSRAQALAILERACDRVLDAQSYFAALRGRPGLYRAMQRSIDDLRHAGLQAFPELPAEAFEDARKASDLTRVLGAYEEELHERKFVDRFGVLARALQLVEGGTPSPWSRDARVVVAADLELSSAETRLLEAIAPAGAALRVETRNAVDAALTIGFVRAIGEENEVRHALRQAAPFDDAEVLYTAREPYLALAYELTAEHAIPATFAEGISSAYTRPGQAALAFLRWIANDFDAVHLQKIARAGSIRTGSDALTPFALGRILRDARIGWGRARYVPRIEALLAALEATLGDTDSETRIAGLQREVVRARDSLTLVLSLLAITDSIADGSDVDSVELAQVTLRFLDGFAVTKGEIDGMALAALRRMLLELTRLPDARAARKVAIERLMEAIAGVHVAASNPRPGHLHVAPLRNGGWSGRTALFVVGLDDAKHPGSGLQDPIVLDQEREKLNAGIHPHALDLLGDAPARASSRLRSLFARAPYARWTLSWAELDLRERRPGFPSRDVLEVYRAVRTSDATFEDLMTEATPVGFLEEARPLTMSEWWLTRRGDAPESAEDVWRAARASDAITEYDGRIHVDRAEIDPRLTGKVTSASQLERMARCPFGWFLERVLKIAPLEELERTPDQWLDNRQFGLLVHDVLEQTMNEITASGSTVSRAEHLPRMEAIAAAALETWRAEVPPGTETAFARQREELLATCDIFLRTEERLSGRIAPRWFEVSFGIDAPFAIPLGDGSEVRLRGWIDRVDQDVATGDWEVWDYKTGSLYEYHDAWQLKHGTKLQHVIYARALEHILRLRGLTGHVQSSGYYFPTTKGDGAREARTCAPGDLELALTRLFDVVGSGFFPQPNEGRCSFCPYPDVCGDPREVAERMRRKQDANADDPAVRAWRALQEMA